MPLYYILALVVSFLLAASPALEAQTVSPAMMQMVQGELKKRGLTETEVRTRLLQKGIDLEKVPPAELPQYQARVTAVLDELEAEKKAGAKTAPVQTATGQPININVGNTGTATDSTKVAAVPVTTPKEAAAEASQRVIQAEAVKKEGPSTIYGHSLFTDHSLDVFRTTDGAQAPDTYVLGEGDEIHISIFGASQTDIQQRISPDGFIQPTGVAKIFLKGLALAQAREVIKKNLSAAYLFRGDQLAVTIVTARTIMVNVFGEARITGGFNLSALNSAFNALSAAGGPTDIGSVREIQLIRGNERKTIDVYAFMNDPAIQFKFDLQNNDILFVPIIKKLVSIEGAVNRPMSYEMLASETLTDLIRFAGGLKMNVYPDFVQIQRYVNGEEKLMEWNLSEVSSGKIQVPLLNGDVIRIKSVGKPMDQYVDVEGSVYYPGRFDLLANPTLSSLLKKAKPTYQAKTDILFVERTRPDETVELLTLPFPETETGANDFVLQARDRIRIMDQATYRDVSTIIVTGQVRQPFEKTFSLTDRLTVKEAIELAGGLKNSAYPIAYILRRNLFNPVEMKYIRIELSSSDGFQLQPGDQLNIFDNTSFTDVGEVSVLGAVRQPFKKTFAVTDRLTIKQAIEIAGGVKATVYPVAYIFRRNLINPVEVKYIRIDLSLADNMELQAGDQLNIYDNTTYTNVGELTVFGAVKNPNGFTYDPSMTVRDLLTNAGGFNVGAAFDRVEVFRLIFSTTEKTKLELITLQVDSSYQVVSPKDFKLQPYDQVIVRLTPEFTLGRTVELSGQVKYPGKYVLESKQTTFSDVVIMAGGLLDDADPYGTRLFRTYNNRGNISMNLRAAMTHKGNISKNPILFEGDVININRLENTVSILENGTRMAQYSVNPENHAIRNIVFQGPNSAAWYIRNYAGGFLKEADRNSVTVTLPNNQMVSTKRFLFFRDYPTVKSGSTITLQMKPPKVETAPAEKKKVDWDAIWTKTLAFSTTMVTLLVLYTQLK
jgi:protein involved in polysaccharide export with SLBB domain